MLTFGRKWKSMARTSSILRPISSKCRLLEWTMDNEGIATVQIQRPPVNSMNLDLISSIHDIVDEVTRNKCKGMVLTSAYPKVFSSGADLMELHNPDAKKLEIYFESIIDTVTKLYGAKLITTAAINGYTGAAACILTMACDYRVMVQGTATIGLNDTVIGIQPGKWIIDLMIRTIGIRQTEYAITSSAMFPVEKALKIGLIDEIATDNIDAIVKCKKFIKKYDNIPTTVNVSTKLAIRESFLTDLTANKKQYAQHFGNTMASSEIQQKIKDYIQTLKEKKNVRS